VDNPFIQMGHYLPIELPSDILLKIKTAVFTALDRAGVTHGPCHSEIILDGLNVYIVEINTRPGSSPIPDLIQEVCGINLYTLAFDWFLGDANPSDFALKPRKGAAVRHLSATPGRITSISGVEHALLVKGIRSVFIKRAVGDVIPPLRSAFDRIGYVTATGCSATDAYRRCCEAADRIHFEVDRI
jgi:biotin carboxylase